MIYDRHQHFVYYGLIQKICSAAGGVPAHCGETGSVLLCCCSMLMFIFYSVFYFHLSLKS